MFKCQECGSEYKEKPDFCDCGNDTFDEIGEKKSQNVLSEKIKSINKSELLSWIFFFICVVLSTLILIFFPKIDNQIQNPNTPDTNAVLSKDIPNLNSFWIDCKPQEEEVKPAEPLTEVLNIFKPAVQNVKQQPKKEVKPQQVKQAAAKNNVQKSKPVQVKKTVSQTTVKPKQTVKTKSTDIEMLNYINGLLNRFKSNLVLAGIDEEGSCVVEFSIDENGKLINRNFNRKSEVKSVNDAVYKMMMRTPVYNPPPDSYNGKTLRVYIKLSPSYYEISLMK